MPLSSLSSVSNRWSFGKSPRKSSFPIRYSDFYTTASSVVSPTSPVPSLTSCTTGQTLPDDHTDVYGTWLHASYLFHRRQYTAALLVFQYLVCLPNIPRYILRRLQINIGLTHLACAEYKPAFEAFAIALSMRELSSNEFITGIGSESPRNTAKDVTALCLFLLGITACELGVTAKAQLFFDDCVGLFDECERPQSEAFERATRYINFGALGLAFLLDIGQARRNSTQCAAKLKLERRITMRSLFKWELLRMPDNIIFEADKTLAGHKDGLNADKQETDSDDEEGSLIEIYYEPDTVRNQTTTEMGNESLRLERKSFHIDEPASAKSEDSYVLGTYQKFGNNQEYPAVSTTNTVGKSDLKATTQHTLKHVTFDKAVEDMELARESREVARASKELTRPSTSSTSNSTELAPTILRQSPPLLPHTTKSSKKPEVLSTNPIGFAKTSMDGATQSRETPPEVPSRSPLRPPQRPPYLKPGEAWLPYPIAPKKTQSPPISVDKPLPPLPLYSATDARKNMEVGTWVGSVE